MATQRALTTGPCAAGGVTRLISPMDVDAPRDRFSPVLAPIPAAHDGSNLVSCIARARDTVAASKPGEGWANLRRVRIPSRLLAQFARGLGAMYNAGVPIGRAMALMADQPESLEWGLVIAKINQDLQNGRSLEACFAEFPNIFDPTWMALIRRALADGSLGDTLTTLSDMYTRNEQLRGRIYASCTYPLIVFGFSVLVACAAFGFLLPQIIGAIAGTHVNLPFLTQLLIFTFNVSTHPLLLVELPLIVWLNVQAFRRFMATERGRLCFDHVRCALPIVGPLARKIAIAKLMHSLRATLSRGIRLTLALELAGASCGNALYHLHMMRCVQALRDGERLSTMFNGRLYDQMVYYSLHIGEDCGRMDRMVDSLAQYYDLEVSCALSNMLTLLEPILIFVTGLMVAGVVIAIFLPLYGVVGGFGG